MYRYFALIDCNNFYASCEAAFDPDLAGRPVVILSNNDGCVIARNAVAKRLEIPMGEPLFKLRRRPDIGRIRIFSSNYALYGDLSRRVMNIIAQNCADVEVYSIDEAFAELTFLRPPTREELLAWGRKVRREVRRCTGIFVSVGIAANKTLAKLANRVGKIRRDGAFFLDAQSPLLGVLDISKVWGVGKRYELRLRRVGVNTVRELADLRPGWIRQEFGVVGTRLHRELNGEVCLELEPPVSSRKHTMVSRSFPHDLDRLEDLEQKAAVYVSRLGEKLREYDQCARHLTVYLWLNKYKVSDNFERLVYSRGMTLPLAADNTGELIGYAIRLLRQVYQKGLSYKKLGVMAGEICAAGAVQGNIFADPDQHARGRTLMEHVDAINKREGRHMVFNARCERRPLITTAQAYLSDGRYGPGSGMRGFFKGMVGK